MGLQDFRSPFIGIPKETAMSDMVPKEPSTVTFLPTL